MAVGGVEILFVGDIHLGKSPSRIPEKLQSAELSPAAAWRNTVDHALRTRVDAVVLAGDVIEGIHDRFEAFPDLEEGVRRLTEAGIEVFGVAGNHDVEALPRIAERLPTFRLLGAGGNWEPATVHGSAGGEVDLLGWSFPRERVTTSPLDSLTHGPRPGVAMLGVLHGDLDRPSSPHAPISRAVLQASAQGAWFLGHIHKPGDLNLPRPVGYLGSISGVDFGPGERGRHGPWRVRVEGTQITEIEQLALAPVRYERIDIAIDDLEGTEDREADDILSDAIFQTTQEFAEEVRDDESADALRVLAFRIRLTGREPEPGFLSSLNLEKLQNEVIAQASDLSSFVEKIEVKAGIAIDLEATATGSDPMALLAQRILTLIDDGPEARALIDAARGPLEDAYAGQYRMDEDEVPDVREVLLSTAWRLLDELRAQKPQATAS